MCTPSRKLVGQLITSCQLIRNFVNGKWLEWITNSKESIDNHRDSHVPCSHSIWHSPNITTFPRSSARSKVITTSGDPLPVGFEGPMGLLKPWIFEHSAFLSCSIPRKKRRGGGRPEEKKSYRIVDTSGKRVGWPSVITKSSSCNFGNILCPYCLVFAWLLGWHQNKNSKGIEQKTVSPRSTEIDTKSFPPILVFPKKKTLWRQAGSLLHFIPPNSIWFFFPG